MGTKRVAVVGYGAVGKGIHRLFPEAVVYDGPLGIGSREEVNRCHFAFVAVPTRARDDGSCDLSVVEEAVACRESDARSVELPPRRRRPAGTARRQPLPAGP
jgi:UDPglucose 6-dehydrogenase